MIIASLISKGNRQIKKEGGAGTRAMPKKLRELRKRKGA
jgi:hypothetical protein